MAGRVDFRGAGKAIAGALPIALRGWPLLAIGFLTDCAFIFVFLIALQDYLPESLGGSAEIAAYALASFGLAKLLSQVAGGVLADRFGVRRTLIAGAAVLLAANTTMLVLAHVSAPLVVAVAALYGFGSAVTWPPVYSAASFRFNEGEIARFTALLSLATGAAVLVGIGAGTLLNVFASFDEAMVLPIGLSVAGLVIALSMRFEARESRPPPQERPVLLGERVRRMVTPRRLAFAALVISNSAALGALAAVFRAYGRDVVGVSLTREALLLAPAAVLGAAAVVPGGAIADHLGLRPVMAIGFTVAGVCLLLLAHFSGQGAVVLLAAAAAIAFGLAIPTISASMLALAGPEETRGALIGWFMTADGLGNSAGPALAGLLVGSLGVRAVLLAVSALFLVVAGIGAALPGRPIPRPWPATSPGAGSGAQALTDP